MDISGKATDSESDGNYYVFHGDHGLGFINGVLNFNRMQQIEIMKPANASDFNGNKRIEIAIGAALSGVV